MEDSQALTQFQQNPGRYLQSVRDSPPSAAAAARLAHSVATAFKNNDTDTTSNATTNSLTASLYLQAAVKQLPAVRSTAAVAGGNAPDAQMKRSQIVTHIVEVCMPVLCLSAPFSLVCRHKLTCRNHHLSSLLAGRRTRRHTMSTAVSHCTIGYLTRLGQYVAPSDSASNSTIQQQH